MKAFFLLRSEIGSKAFGDRHALQVCCRLQVVLLQGTYEGAYLRFSNWVARSEAGFSESGLF